jgi:hypothetical protein
VECRISRVCELLFLEEEEEVMATLTETNSAATFAIITEVLVIEKQVRSLPNSNGDSASVSFETWVEYVHVSSLESSLCLPYPQGESVCWVGASVQPLAIVYFFLSSRPIGHKFGVIPADTTGKEGCDQLILQFKKIKK